MEEILPIPYHDKLCDSIPGITLFRFPMRLQVLRCCLSSAVVLLKGIVKLFTLMMVAEPHEEGSLLSYRRVLP